MVTVVRTMIKTESMNVYDFEVHNTRIKCAKPSVNEHGNCSNSAAQVENTQALFSKLNYPDAINVVAVRHCIETECMNLMFSNNLYRKRNTRNSNAIEVI